MPRCTASTCYPSLSALPERVDAAFLAVPSTSGPDLVDEAGRCGIPALFLNANGYADGDETGVKLQRRVEETAARYGIVICGPNNLGLINVHDRVAMWSPRYMKVLEPGSLGVISQSGSIALILSEDERDLGFAYLVTAGQRGGAHRRRLPRRHGAGRSRQDHPAVPGDDARSAGLRRASRSRRAAVANASSRSSSAPAPRPRAGAGAHRRARRRGPALRRLFQGARTSSASATSTRCWRRPCCCRCTAIRCRRTCGDGDAVRRRSRADRGHRQRIGLKFPTLAAETLARLRPAFPPYSSISNPVDAWGLGFDADRFKIVLARAARRSRHQPDRILGGRARPGRRRRPLCLRHGAGLRRREVRQAARLLQQHLRLRRQRGCAQDPRCGANIAYLSGMRPALAAISHA